MPKLTKENWKGGIWVGTALFVQNLFFEPLFIITKGFSSVRFWGTAIQMVFAIFFITLGVLKYKDAPRWITVTLTIAIPVAFLLLCFLISLFFHEAA